MFEAEAHGGRHSVVRVALQVLDQVLPRVVLLAAGPVLHVREADVLVCVDEGRNHRLSRQVHAHGPRRGLPLPLLAHPGEPAPLDQEGRALDRASVTYDEPRPFEPHRASRSLRRLGRRRAGGNQKEERDRKSSEPYHVILRKRSVPTLTGLGSYGCLG